MKTTSAAFLLLGAGLASELMTGCVPFGCGAPSDPTNIATFALSNAGVIPVGQAVHGIAYTPDGVWLATTGASGSSIDEYTTFGGSHVRGWPLPADPRGVAFDGTELWVGEGTSAQPVDPVSGPRATSIALPDAAEDLAWDDGLVIAAGLADFEVVDPSTQQLVAAVPVHKLDSVSAVAYHDGETWIATVGGPILVYDATGTLLATASADAVAADGRTTELHLTFDGEALVIARGDVVYRYSIDRTVTPQ